jgi:hypothetical protein
MIAGRRGGSNGLGWHYIGVRRSSGLLKDPCRQRPPVAMLFERENAAEKISAAAKVFKLG